MNLNRNFSRSVLLVFLFCSAMAEPTSKQVALDAIIARVHDSAHPQTSAETDRQLKEWAAKYKGTLRERFIGGSPTAGPATDEERFRTPTRPVT